MSRRKKIIIVSVAVALTVSTPFFWLLDTPDTGQLVAASVQGATGVIAPMWALVHAPDSPPCVMDRQPPRVSLQNACIAAKIEA